MNIFLETCGWLGALCFAICAFPQAIKSFKEGHSRGISLLTVILWNLGEILTLIYIIPAEKWPVVFNCSLSLVGCLIILYYKIWERKDVK